MCGAEIFLFINEKSGISRAVREVVRLVTWGSEPSVRIEVPTETRSDQCSGFLKSKALCDTWTSPATLFPRTRNSAKEMTRRKPRMSQIETSQGAVGLTREYPSE